MPMCLVKKGGEPLTTKELERRIFFALNKMGTYLCFEVKMPTVQNGVWVYDLQRVDLLSYSTKGIWRFYELKVTKSDFHSKAKHTFLGHYNYFVMPVELYEQVKDEIPEHIGCYVAYNTYEPAKCVKRPKRQELKVPHEDLLLAFTQALSREVKNAFYAEYYREQERNKNA